MHRSIGIVLTIVMSLGLGCSGPAADSGDGSITESPEEVAEQIMAAASAVDEDAFMALLTEKARESMASDDDGNFAGREYESYEVGDATVDGIEASVPVEAVAEGEPERLDLKLRQEDGAWRLYAIAMEIAPGNSMTVNFENIGQMMEAMVEGLGEAMGEAFSSAMENAFQMGSPEEAALKAAMFDAFDAVDLAVYETSWKNTEDYRGKPRLEAITQLAEASDLKVYAGDHAESLGGAVETDVQGLSRLEAIERIANEANLYSALPNLQDWGVAGAFMEGMASALGAMIGGDDAAVSVEGDAVQESIENALSTGVNAPQDAITFDAQAPAQPAQFIGPFRLDLVSIEENAPYATGDLMMQIAAYGLPAPVLMALEQQDEALQIHAVESPGGQPLIDMNVSYMGGGSVAGSAFNDMAMREMSGLLRSVDRIARISGAVDVNVPTIVEEVEFDALASGASQEVGGITITVDEVDSYASFDVTGDEAALDSLNVIAQAYGADGSPMPVHYTDYQSWQAGEGTISLNADAKPSRVRLKLVLASETLSYPYEFTDVPLRQFSEQPEALAELDFGGHDAPLVLSFDGIVERDPSFSKITVTVENVSNKEPESVFVDFVYLDANGAELDSFPHTINGAFTVDGFEPLAKPGQSAKTEQTAFQMPESTQSIAFRLNSVDFMDGTQWEAE